MFCKFAALAYRVPSAMCEIYNLLSIFTRYLSLPPRLRVSACSAFVARVFGAWDFAVLDCSLSFSSTYAFVAWVFGGWSFGRYCQGVTRYRIACQALADTAKA